MGIAQFRSLFRNNPSLLGALGNSTHADGCNAGSCTLKMVGFAASAIGCLAKHDPAGCIKAIGGLSPYLDTCCPCFCHLPGSIIEPQWYAVCKVVGKCDSTPSTDAVAV